MKTIDVVIEQCEEIANASKQHTLHMTHFSQSYDEWAEEWTQIAEWLKELKAYKEQSGDAISRQAAIDALTKTSGIRGDALKALYDLPSVTPQPRTGRWIQKEEEGEAEPFIIWECSECHCVDEDGKPSYKYCPQCGAKMEVEE